MDRVAQTLQDNQEFIFCISPFQASENFYPLMVGVLGSKDRNYMVGRREIWYRKRDLRISVYTGPEYRTRPS